MVHHPLRLTLDGDALASNWHWLAHRSAGAACGAAVKADAYGLGARQAVKRLQEAGCRDFFVATWAEADALMPWPGDLSLSVLHGIGPSLLEGLASGRPVNHQVTILCKPSPETFTSAAYREARGLKTMTQYDREKGARPLAHTMEVS